MKEKIVCCGNCIFWVNGTQTNKYGEKCVNMFSCRWCDNWKGK